MLKKKISMIASFAAFVLTTSVIIGCGIPLEIIAKRPISNPDVYRTFFNLPLTSWSSGITNSANDNKVLADLVGTLVAKDKYGRSYGDIAYQTPAEKKSRFVGKPNSDFTEWTYKIAPDATWFDYTGAAKRNIRASDMVNTAKYVLFPKNLSQTFSLWISFIKGAEAIWSYFQNSYKLTPGVPYYNEQIWEKLGVKTVGTDEVTFQLVKQVPYFDTLMTYLAFAPLPECALTEGYNYGRNYDTIWYSGAYLVEEYDTSKRILLKRNDQYRFSKLTYIKNIDYIHLEKVDISRPRLLFESGDLTEFIVSPSDNSGWNRYIGHDINNPIFGAVAKHPNSKVGTYFLLYNFANTNILNGKDSATKTEALNASKALQYDKIRKMLALNLDRNKFVRYFSEALDNNNTSNFLRNTYTPKEFIHKEDKDYTTYIAEEYANTYLQGDVDRAKTLLNDGNDAYFHNPDLLEAEPNFTNQIRSWLENNLGQSKVTLKLLINGSNLLTSNKNLLDMIDSFNHNNDVITIKPDVTVDSNEYSSRSSSSDYDIRVSGWLPDFSDPFSFLNTFTLKGDLQSYFGTSRIFSDLVFNNDGFAPNFSELKLNNLYWNSLKDNPAMANFYDMFKNYTDQVKISDEIASEEQLDARYEGFAKAEFKALYQDYMFLPLLVPEGTFRMYVSYVLPRTRVTVGYGSSQYKHWGMKISPYLLKRNEVVQLESKYEDELDVIKIKPDAFRDDY